MKMLLINFESISDQTSLKKMYYSCNEDSWTVKGDMALLPVTAIL